MNTDSHRSRPDVRFTFAGPGVPTRWKCANCHTARGMTGRKRIAGTTLYRCAACVAQRDERRAA